MEYVHQLIQIQHLLFFNCSVTSRLAFATFLGHSYIIYRFIHDGVLFTGPNDGIEQMIPIQMFLFDKWSVGNLFLCY